jgi:hypothetical protein
MLFLISMKNPTTCYLVPSRRQFLIEKKRKKNGKSVQDKYVRISENFAIHKRFTHDRILRNFKQTENASIFMWEEMSRV